MHTLPSWLQELQRGIYGMWYISHRAQLWVGNKQMAVIAIFSSTVLCSWWAQRVIIESKNKSGVADWDKRPWLWNETFCLYYFLKSKSQGTIGTYYFPNQLNVVCPSAGIPESLTEVGKEVLEKRKTEENKKKKKKLTQKVKCLSSFIQLG